MELDNFDTEVQCEEFYDEDEYDGQPTELEEWLDFDPDC